MAHMHVMIDIETMGSRPNAPILSIGACTFSPATGEIGEKYYVAIDPKDALRHGTPCGDTSRWWMQQSDQARAAAVGGKASLKSALMGLVEFRSDWKDVKIWSNGPNFDDVILQYAFHRIFDKPAPWAFWNTRCCRTIAEIAGKRPPKIGGAGVHHNALDDAIHQAKWVSEMWQGIHGAKAPKTIDPLDDL